MMRQRLLGPSGLRVSEVCLGSLTFGEPRAWGASPEVVDDILRTFVDAGGTFIDTAPNYADGAAETLIGRFLQGRRDDMVVATKFTAAARAHPLAGGNSRRSLVRSVEESLKRLGTDRIDLLWLHYWDGTTPLDEILRAVDDLVRAGKVLYLGLSDTPAWLVSRAVLMADLRGWSPVIAVQVEYSAAVRAAAPEFLPMADALGLGVVCWGPLAAGALAGGAEPRRRAVAALPPAVGAAARALNDLMTQTGLTAPALALRWLIQARDPGLIPLVGARTVDQMVGLLEAVAEPIDVEIMSRIAAISPPTPGFPHALIASSYLRKLALGDPDLLDPPSRRRA